jgi:hypothetical protein
MIKYEMEDLIILFYLGFEVSNNKNLTVFCEQIIMDYLGEGINPLIVDIVLGE